jgi:hypothetical protein
MKASAELALLLPVLFGLVPLAAGCGTPFGGAASGKEGTPGARPSVNISRVNFLGWKDACRMTNGEFQVVIVPEIARIMAYGPVRGENVLWVNEDLTPERHGGLTVEPTRTEWQNFGGDKLWPAPEKSWTWPPDWQLDRGRCRAKVTAGGTLRLIGTPSLKHGIRFDREITLAPQGSRLDIVQTAVNVCDKAVTASIWDVTQVRSDCVGFVPLGPSATLRTGAGGPPDEQWQRVSDMLLVKPSGKNGKLFISGPPGWLGARRGDMVYVKVFDMPATPPPEPETPREVYTSNIGYIELETVGPAVNLKPGETTTVKETWHLLPAGPEAATDEGLIKTVRELAAGLGLHQG